MSAYVLSKPRKKSRSSFSLLLSPPRALIGLFTFFVRFPAIRLIGAQVGRDASGALRNLHGERASRAGDDPLNETAPESSSDKLLFKGEAIALMNVLSVWYARPNQIFILDTPIAAKITHSSGEIRVKTVVPPSIVGSVSDDSRSEDVTRICVITHRHAGIDRTVNNLEWEIDSKDTGR